VVGAFEADATKDLISIVAPLGEALIGKNVGDEIDVTSPNGVNRYRLVALD